MTGECEEEEKHIGDGDVHERDSSCNCDYIEGQAIGFTAQLVLPLTVSQTLAPQRQCDVARLQEQGVEMRTLYVCINFNLSL